VVGYGVLREERVDLAQDLGRLAHAADAALRHGVRTETVLFVNRLEG
jgi:hypothetical protein